MNSFRSRLAAVTGGGSGIGRSVAFRLARLGHSIAVLDINAAAARSVAKEISAAGSRSLAVETDVSRSESVREAFARVGNDLGDPAILVHCAGIAAFCPVAQMEDEQFDRMIAVHLRGTFLCNRAVVAPMVAAGWGRIVNISSVAGLAGAAGLAHYAAAKAAIIGFSKSLAQEIGPAGVTVNVIAPGMIDTPMLHGSGIPNELLDASARRTPVKRLGTPDDVAAACAYLVSDDAGFVTGQVLSPNGGLYI